MVDSDSRYNRKHVSFWSLLIIKQLILSIALIVAGIVFYLQLNKIYWLILSLIGILGIFNVIRIWKSSKWKKSYSD